MITKNIFLFIALFINFSLFSMEEAHKSLVIDFKQYNFTSKEEELLKRFEIEKDHENNQFKVNRSDHMFKIGHCSNNYQQNVAVLIFDFKIFEVLPLCSPKIQHFVKAMYYVAFCKSKFLKGRENLRHEYISVFMQNMSFYAPQANNFNIETCIVSSESLNYALFSTLVIMIFGSGTSLLLNDENIFYQALQASMFSTLMFVGYGLGTGK